MRTLNGWRGWFVLSVLALAALACNLPRRPSDAELTGTAVAALATAVTQAGPTEAPAASPTPGGAPSPTAPQQGCIAEATTDVNIRTGPSTFYPITGIFQEDGQRQVTGHNGSRTWWQVGQGWVSGSYVTTSGDCANVPVASFPPPPPTPTPTSTPTPTPTATTAPPTETEEPELDFTAAYEASWACGSEGRVTLQIENTGEEALNSMQVTLEGPPGTVIGTGSQNSPFKAASAEPSPACTEEGEGRLEAGETAYVHLTGVAPAAGEDGKATIRMCTRNDLGGVCKEVVIEFEY